MQITEIEKAWWTDAHARECFAWTVRKTLVGVKKPIGSTQLLALAGVTLKDQSAVKNVLAHLSNARKTGLLDGFFTQGLPTNGTRGFPSYKWHEPRLTEGDFSEKDIAYWIEKQGMTREQSIARCKEGVLAEMIGYDPDAPD